MISPLNTIAILSNGLTLAVALGFLIIALWHDTRKELNQFFAAFLFLVMLWNVGSLLVQAGTLLAAQENFLSLAVGVMEMGFTGSAVAIYVLLTVLIGAQTRRFRLLALAGLLLVMVYRVFLIASGAPLPLEFENDVLSYQPEFASVLFFLTFDGATLYLVSRYRPKIGAQSLVVGIVIFIVGQSIGFLNSEFQTFSLSVTVSSIGTLIISFSILRREIITPLSERVSQVEAMHKVSVAIASRLGLETVLNEIASQAAEWLSADGVGVFFSRDDGLELVTAYNLPARFAHVRLKVGQGVAGTVAARQESIFLENYGRDWKGEPDLPYAKETFGSVISVPLIYDAHVIGVLMVIAGLQGRLFSRDDVRLLELLAAQAAVAISHSQLFDQQVSLTNAVENARSQLETVLVSTENPVVAIDRGFRLIFANPAARKLFALPEDAEKPLLTDILPRSAFPQDYREVLRDLHQHRVHIYEISFEDKVYLCHLARLGATRTRGWVAVLNDVTKLKELDRMKSEMVRMTSHDLKNPLQAAMANLELLHDDLTASGDIGAEVQESVRNIEKQLQRMNRIIRGILDLERVRAGVTTTELCSPQRIVEDAVDAVAEFARDQHIDLVVNIEAAYSFLGDAEQFERALTNLLENAIKFTPRGGRVSVNVQRQNDHILFAVQDSGIGIPEELQSRIFDRFFRGRQKGVEHVSGSGLGLSLVKTIVDNHHGHVWLTSKEGEGSTFFITIPIVSTN